MNRAHQPSAGRTRRPIRSGVFVLLAALLLGACDDPGGPDPDAHVGTYQVVSVNGENLPFLALVFDGRTTHILAGSVTLRADGTATDTYTYRYTDDREVIEQTTFAFGTYSRSAESVSVRWESGIVEYFDYAADELTLSKQGLLVRYRK